MRFNPILSLLFFILFQLFTACSASQPAQHIFQPNRLMTVDEISLLKEAKDSYDRGFYGSSINHWKNLITLFPRSSILPIVYIKLADCYYLSGQYNDAINTYKKFIKQYPSHEAIAYAKYQIALSYMKTYKGAEHDQTPIRKSIEVLEKLISDQPTNLYHSAAKQKLKELEDKLFLHEKAVIQYLAKRGQWNAVQARFNVMNVSDTKKKEALSKWLADNYPERKL